MSTGGQPILDLNQNLLGSYNPWNQTYFLRLVFFSGTICFHLRNHLFSPYTKFSAKLTFFTPWSCTCTYLEVRNVTFSENFAYVLNGWSLNILHLIMPLIKKVYNIFHRNPSERQERIQIFFESTFFSRFWSESPTGYNRVLRRIIFSIKHVWKPS